MVKTHHVNLGVLPDGLDAEAAFLVDVLKYKAVKPPEEVASRANWFESEDGVQIHLSLDPKHRPAAAAHVAIEVGDGLAAIEQYLNENGVKYGSSDNAEFRVVLCRDPAGNRWELRGALAS